MRLTQKLLKKMIREELEKSLTTEMSDALAQRIKGATKCPKGMVTGGSKSSKNPLGCYWPEEKCPKGQEWSTKLEKCVRPAGRALPKGSKRPEWAE